MISSGVPGGPVAFRGVVLKVRCDSDGIVIETRLTEFVSPAERFCGCFFLGIATLILDTDDDKLEIYNSQGEGPLQR